MDKEELLIYNTVLNNLPDEHIPTDVCIETIQKKAGKLDAMTADVLYAFIRRYEMDEGGDVSKTLPYGCKVLKKGLKVDLALLPHKLLLMMYVFLTKYYSSDND